MTEARFIVSLDCEGKWGMADKLEPYHHELLTDEALANVYRDIIALFGRHQIAATFAFVMAFTLDAAERARFRHLLDADDGKHGEWLSHYQRARDQGDLAGWFQPEALEIVRANPEHEIACHSFCHRPLAEELLSAEGAAAELDAAEEVARAKRLTLRTFIFPRNKVGNLPALSEHGYLGYRDERSHGPGRIGRVLALAEELHLWPKPERAARPAAGELVCIPAGYFFNWRRGLRRRIPPALTVRRWKNLLDRTAAKGGVAHLWLHPHNLITAPETKDTLDEVLAHAAKLCSEGRLRNVTQEAYCREILAPSV